MKTIGNNAKVLHFRDKLDDLAAGRVTPPIHVRLKLTNRCNHRCFYCCYRNREFPLSEQMDERDEIPREKMHEIIADLARMGVKAVTFSGGGEPLLYPHIVETIRGLAAAHIRIAMLTNGALLSGAAAELLAIRAAGVRVSMDAANGTDYATSRGVCESEFGRVCHNIRNFAGLSGRTAMLGIHYIVTRQNAESVLDFLQLAKQLGAQHVTLSLVSIGASAGANAYSVAPIFDRVKQQIAEATERLADESFTIADDVRWPETTEEGFPRTHARCPFIQCLTVIAADQNVYICQDKVYSRMGLLGSIRDRSFAELWADDETQQRLLTMNPSEECHHHCGAQAKNDMLLDYLNADCEYLDFV